MNIDLLDAALGNTERLFGSLRAFRGLCGEIVDFEEEAKRAKADAEVAQKSLADLQSKVTVAQADLDKLQAQREQTEAQCNALRSEQAALTDAINQIKRKFRDAA
jgi:peptidoglycan hydrolase CwlO-like protein